MTKELVALVAIALFGASIAAAQPVPPELSALIAKAGLAGRMAAWCEGEFHAGQPTAYAVAIATGDRGGRYVVLERDTTVVELASFTGGVDLACYSATEARKLDRTVGSSETVHGWVAPRWTTAVVCGFVEDTRALCWQYSPADRAFVKIGEWIT